MEKDTCRDYALPLLTGAGWSEDQIQEQFPITDGRIVTVRRKHRRGEALRADYVLEYVPGVPIAVVEAKLCMHPSRLLYRLDRDPPFGSGPVTVVQDTAGAPTPMYLLGGGRDPRTLWPR